MSLNMGMVMGSGRGATPSWVLRTAAGLAADWDADIANERYWFDGAVSFAFADFLTAIGGTFARSGSNATFVGSNKLIQITSGSNVPRLGFSPDTGVALGLLIEDTRKNEVIQSEDFGTTWSEVGTAVVSTNTDVSPDGNTTADTLTDNDAGSAEHVEQTITGISNSDEYGISWFVKKDAVAASTRFPMIQVKFTVGTATTMGLGLDTSDGTVATAVQAGSGTVVDSGVDDWGDYWRAWFVAANDASGNTSMQILCYPSFGANADKVTASDAATGSIVPWGVQAEQMASGLGNNISSYIPTTTVAVTRAGESCVTTFADTPDIPWKGWNTLAGTIYIEGTPFVEDNNNNHIYFTIQDAGNDTNEAILLQTTSGGNVQMKVTVASASVASITAVAGLAVHTLFKAAYSWKADDFELNANGTAATPDTGGALPVVTRAFIGGHSFAQNTSFGHTGRAAYFDTDLSAADLDTVATL